MSANPDDRTISVTSLDPDEQAGAHREPLGPDGQPIFPPSGDAGTDPAARDDLRTEDDRRRDDELAGGYVTDAQAGQDYPAGYEGQTGYESQSDEAYAAAPSAAPTVAPGSDAPAHQATQDDQEWQALQVKFVDDPASAVREAADRVERELAAARGRLDSADTEELRTAFRRFRGLSDALR